MRPTCALLALLLLPAAARPQTPANLGLRFPAGFEVTEFADGKLANDIFCMTLDPRGRVIVSGRGYVRALVDDDGDGRADRALDFPGAPKDGAQGMLWEGDSLYFTGGGGLRRYRDRDGDGRPDGPHELIRAMKTGGEHDAHAIHRGPDGWLYVLCGNNTGVNRAFATLPTSPVAEPVAGCVLRFAPDLKGCEIVADGFRNSYGMDFNTEGELFAFDSDNERCVSLPWYEYTRFYHVIPGGRHGWLSPHLAQWWRLPPYLPDVVAPVATLGRGSPTGVVCYRHTQFPERYRGGFFLLDWTFGKVHFVALKRAGATYASRQEVFLEAVGDNGFAPTAAAVHPATGDLFVSVGGRGTRGAVYRVRYPQGLRPKLAADASRRALPRLSLDWRAELRQALPAQARSRDALDRLRALVALRRHREHFPTEELSAAIRANWVHADRYVRKAAADLIALLPERDQRDLVPPTLTPDQQATYGLGVCAADPVAALDRATDLLTMKEASLQSRRTAVRVAQLALGDLVSPKVKGTVWEGYTARQTALLERGHGTRWFAHLRTVFRRAFPSGDWELDREVARTLAVLEDDDAETLARIAQRLTDQSPPPDTLHYLIVLARLKGHRSPQVTAAVANYLLGLDREIAAHKLTRDRHWPLRMAELHAELARRDPRLNAALLAHAEFGRPDHALLARTPGFDRPRAAEVFLKRAAKDVDYPWNADVVEVVGALPPERALPVLRQLWGKAGLEATLLPLLARHPEPADRRKFVEGLASPQPATVRLCLEALRKLPGKADGSEVLALIQALGRLPEGREAAELRSTLADYLKGATGQTTFGADRQAWTDWFARTHPALAARLRNPDGVDVAAWAKRLARIDWAQGHSERGRGVFVRTSCATCHSGGQALGPDLAGVAGRFARADLFTAILQPSRDVSPRYRTTVLETADGKLYQGLVIYEAVDGVLLQTGAAATVRVAGDQIAGQRLSTTSLMPAGLLDAVSDRDIADLYAYLRGLGQPAAKDAR